MYGPTPPPTPFWDGEAAKALRRRTAAQARDTLPRPTFAFRAALLQTASRRVLGDEIARWHPPVPVWR